MKKLILTVWNFWFSLPEKIRFLLVGGFNTVVSYLMFICFIHFLGESKYQICLCLSWVVSSVVSFSTQKIFVFETRGHWISEYVKCLCSWSIGYVINAGALELSISVFALNVYIGQASAIILTTIVTYLLFKHFAFKRKQK